MVLWTHNGISLSFDRTPNTKHHPLPLYPRLSSASRVSEGSMMVQIGRPKKQPNDCYWLLRYMSIHRALGLAFLVALAISLSNNHNIGYDDTVAQEITSKWNTDHGLDSFLPQANPAASTTTAAAPDEDSTRRKKRKKKKRRRRKEEEPSQNDAALEAADASRISTTGKANSEGLNPKSGASGAPAGTVSGIGLEQQQPNSVDDDPNPHSPRGTPTVTSPQSNKNSPLFFNNSTTVLSTTQQQKKQSGSRIVFKASIDSENYFWGNTARLAFETNVSLSMSGRLCLAVTIPDPSMRCPYPDVRARLSGVALVDVPLDSMATKTGPSFAPRLHGCAVLPVAGTYFLDMNLLHCTMNAWDHKATSKTLKSQCPLQVVVRKATPFQFKVPSPIQRGMHEAPRSQFPYRAWVFAPICKKSRYSVSKECTEKSKRKPSVVRTKFQQDTFLRDQGFSSFSDVRLTKRYAAYQFLQVNPLNGTIDYGAIHASPYYTPPPPGLTITSMTEKVCFLGDSHARFLAFQSEQIIKNATDGRSGCADKYTQKFNYTYDIFPYEKMRFADEWFQQETQMGMCDVVFVSYGHHDAGFPRGLPTTPVDYVAGVLQVLQRLERVTRATSRIYVLSCNSNAFGSKILECKDWRLPSLLNVYNAKVHELTTPMDDGSLRIESEGLSRSYFIDNSDIMDPMWDSAEDWGHSCQYSVRPLAHRLLSLVKRSPI